MNAEQKIILLAVLGGIAWYVYENEPQVQSAVQVGAAQVTAAVAGWKNAGSGPTWVPVLNQAEIQYGLPTDMLAAIAFVESSFAEANIRGLAPSQDGLSLGIMQLTIANYPSLVGPNVPVPYTDQNVTDQIAEAASVLSGNFSQLNSWEATIASYNQGLTGVVNNGITSTAYVQKVIGLAPAAAVS
jgi:Transglycosylase SLT domain